MNWKNNNDVKKCPHAVIAFFVSLVKFSYLSKFHVSIITGSGVTTIFFIRDWPEIQKFEIPLPEFCPIPGDWGELDIPSLARMSPIKFYGTLQNARVTAFTVSELLRESRKGGGGKITPPPRLGLTKKIYHLISKFHFWKLQQSKEDKFEY